MKKEYILFLLLIISFNAFCQKKQDQDTISFLSFERNQIYVNQKPEQKPKMAWYSNSSQIQVDYLTMYKNEPSLLIAPISTNSVDVHFHFSNRDIVGKKIVFSGKYMFKQAKEAKVCFSIVLDTFLRTIITKKLDIECQGDDEQWKSFSVEMPFERTSEFFFHIQGSGEMKLWIADLDVMVDGQSFDMMVNPTREVDKDIEFTERSGIIISSPNRQTLENLEVLGKVWGFLKYFHPQVVIGKYNWDFELFRILPKIGNAENKTERNKILIEWIDQFGEITEYDNYKIVDSTMYHRYAHLEWTENTSLFDKELIDRFVKIKNAKRNSVFNYYLVPLAWKEEVEFTREKLYQSVSWADHGYRILTLFRLWNAIEYCFPYIKYTDNRWDALLAKYLPEFIDVLSEEALDFTIQKLAAEINDSHGGIYLAKQQPVMRGLPMSLTQTTNGEVVVESTRLREINRGAVILGAKDRTISEIIEYYRPIIPASNERGLIRNITHRLFLTPEAETNVSFEYKRKVHDVTVPTQTFTRDAHIEIKKPDDYRKRLNDIIYLDLGEISADELDKKMQKNNQAKGLILDLRKYPKVYTKDLLEKYLYPKPSEYMWFSMNSKKYPGNFFLDIRGEMGVNENLEYFKGKIAILVNENTQSLGELSAIAYRVAPNSAIIGTQTAGANGHIGYLFLPRGIKFVYTMAGAFYPNWKLNQRCGVKIDIPIKQTIKDIEDGEDIWILKAIEYINKPE
jgi:hypothetical protein